jgi:hypothetical protein
MSDEEMVLQFCSDESSAVLQFCSSAVVEKVLN